MPDYPYSRLTKKECSGYPLFGIEEEDLIENIHASEIQKGKAPMMVDGEVKLNQEQYVTAGDYICTVSGTGKTVKEATDATYKRIKRKIDIPNSTMWRTDIGNRLEKQLPELHSMGYCKDIKYNG